ncbi:MAG: hypothetical protein IH996_07905 [Proteobacteria bacterium]|nr:hypothetical protein [Pseudomonadota bacterium]
MLNKVVSWVLVGAFTYLWWWIGYEWAYLNPGAEGFDWSNVYLLFTLISLVLIHRTKHTA